LDQIRPSEKGQSIICGRDSLPIEGWGEIEVTLKVPWSKKKHLTTLNNVAFIPRLQASVASFYLMHKKCCAQQTGTHEMVVEALLVAIYSTWVTS
jgi:hypothetical protein